jgi:hypothetical protein
VGRRSFHYFGADPDDAHRFVSGLMGWMLDGLDNAARTGALDALHRTMRLVTAAIRG